MENVIIENGIDMILDSSRKNYQTYIYCSGGTCRMTYNGQVFHVKQSSCVVILNVKLVQQLKPSDDFECMVISIDEAFLRQSQPSNPYMIQGMLSLQTSPVMDLDVQEDDLCYNLFRNFKLRLDDRRHKFYDDILRTSTRMLLLDLYDIHSKVSKSDNMSKSSASIMTHFIDMLAAGEYRKNREVAYYAEKLCVVPKYLSEVSNKISGHSASYWINHYTAHELNELLQVKKMSSADVAKMFHFTSTSYFNRYVKRYLGAYPSELRGQ